MATEEQKEKAERFQSCRPPPHRPGWTDGTPLLRPGLAVLESHPTHPSGPQRSAQPDESAIQSSWSAPAIRGSSPPGVRDALSNADDGLCHHWSPAMRWLSVPPIVVRWRGRGCGSPTPPTPTGGCLWSLFERMDATKRGLDEDQFLAFCREGIQEHVSATAQPTGFCCAKTFHPTMA